MKEVKKYIVALTSNKDKTSVVYIMDNVGECTYDRELAKEWTYEQLEGLIALRQRFMIDGYFMSIKEVEPSTYITLVWSTGKEEKVKVDINKRAALVISYKDAIFAYCGSKYIQMKIVEVG